MQIDFSYVFCGFHTGVSEGTERELSPLLLPDSTRVGHEASTAVAPEADRGSPGHYHLPTQQTNGRQVLYWPHSRPFGDEASTLCEYNPFFLYITYVCCMYTLALCANERSVDKYQWIIHYICGYNIVHVWLFLHVGKQLGV